MALKKKRDKSTSFSVSYLLSLPYSMHFKIPIFMVKMFAGDNLYDSAVKCRIPDLPAFALESLPNRNSLIYGDLYRIADEASTIFRATLRYEGKICILLILDIDWTVKTTSFRG